MREEVRDMIEQEKRVAAAADADAATAGTEGFAGRADGREMQRPGAA